jgi:hypothetical protein
VAGAEQTPSEAVGTWGQNYLTVPLQNPSGYNANDCSVADVDGDGILEILLKWDPTNAKDNSQSGVTSNVLIDCYKLNGTRLWRIDLGRNIRAGAHYTQMAFFDFDGDGKAEFMCKTADASIDGKGKVIGNASADYRNSSGYVLTGPEFITVFNGITGAAMATSNYIPARGNVGSWGDTYGNRVDRFRVGVAYLDGKKPTAIFCRGYYTRLVMAAWDWRDGKLTNRWTFDSNNSGNGSYAGQGDHSLSVADVDNDGKQEIISGSAIIDDNGTPYFTTGYGHGDALHASDLDPSVPGIEVVNIQERFDKQGLYMYSATSKKVLWTVPSVAAGSDGEGPGRGVSGDISASSPGAESWAAGAGVTGVYNTKGQKTSLPTPSSCNFLSWWDGDLLRELLNGTSISKYQGSTLLSASGCASNNGTKSTPCLSGDILGDWREEVILRTSDNSALRIYTTTIPTSYKIRTLLHDPQYRVALAWQNGAYNQPPHTGFFIGDKMAEPAKPLIAIAGTTTPVNQFPTAVLTAPANNTNFTSPANITINASAADADGTVSNVQFYNGATLLGSDATSPYSFTWANVAAGTYTLTAVATDNNGAATTSAGIVVLVNNSTPIGVTLQGESACTADGILNESVNAGFNGSGYLNLTNVTGSAATWAVNSNTSQTVSLNIRYANASANSRNMSLSVNGTTQVATVNFPSTGAWTTWSSAAVQVTLAAGRNTLKLTSLMAEGAPNLDELTLGSSTISVASCTLANQLPVVTITSPSNNTNFLSPASITINAAATDADGTVNNVQFFNGTTLLGSDPTSPYSFTWSNVAGGSYSITAQATDNSGAVITSSPVNLIVLTVSPVIQAENACAIDGIVLEAINGGFNGSGYVNTTNAVGASVSWTLNSQIAQSTIVTFRYANASSNNRNVAVKVNGISQVANVDFVSTGAWTTWNSVSVPLTFAAGSNTIQLVSSMSEGAANIDELSFSTGGISQGTCQSAARASLLTFDPAQISPNPSSGTFTLNVPDDAQSISVVNSNGLVVFTSGALAAGETIVFGDSFTSGIYVLNILYNNGRMESRKIQKAL